MHDPLRLTFVTDIVTPYMATVFDALAEQSELRVIYCARSGSRAMPWALDGRLSFQHEVIDGLRIGGHTGDGTDYHVDPRILWRVARSRPDAVFAAGYSIPTVYASLYCTARRRPLLIQSEGTSRSELRLGRVQGIARTVLLRRARVCAAISEPAAARFRELGVSPERIFITPHTTDLEPLWRAARERDYRSGGPLRVLATGRLIPRKGFDRLLLAAARAARGGADLELRIVGNGPAEGELRSLAAELGIEEFVKFSGFLDQADLPAAYAAADAYAFPTLRDPFGIVLVEAAAAGLPLIASPHAGATHDIVRDGENGLIVDPDDLDALAHALVRLAGNPGLREGLGRAAHTSTLGRTPEKTARAYLRAAAAATRS